MEMKEMITVREAARILRVHEQTVREAVQAGRLPAVRLGRVYRIPASAILRPGGERAPMGESRDDLRGPARRGA